MTDPLTRLETEEGSRELDWSIGYSLPDRPGNMPQEFTVSLVGAWLPHYTTSLDAKLPWENIIRVEWLGHRKVWKAFQQPESDTTDFSLFIGEAKTEVLARRVAALRARG